MRIRNGAQGTRLSSQVECRSWCSASFVGSEEHLSTVLEIFSTTPIPDAVGQLVKLATECDFFDKEILRTHYSSKRKPLVVLLPECRVYRTFADFNRHVHVYFDSPVEKTREGRSPE